MPSTPALDTRRQQLLEELAPARFRGDQELVVVLELELRRLEDELAGARGREPGPGNVPTGSDAA